MFDVDKYLERRRDELMRGMEEIGGGEQLNGISRNNNNNNNNTSTFLRQEDPFFMLCNYFGDRVMYLLLIFTNIGA